jgi:3-demethoxyubiquinol 3-hydroxylase
MKRSTRPKRLPGDRAPATTAMIRVDHAGEYGAARIYAGQLAILSQRHAASGPIRHMAAQEQRHLQAFDTLLTERRIAPTLLSPFWHVAGYALGAATALIGPQAAMACTAAVETVIDEHYAAQLEALGDTDAPLGAMIADFRNDEQAHRQTALEHGAEDAFGYPLLSRAIKAGCHIAIRLSERF